MGINRGKTRLRKRREKVGTTRLQPEMRRKKNGEPDFEKELEDLEAELRALGLKK